MPDEETKPLSEEQKARLERWIAAEEKKKPLSERQKALMEKWVADAEPSVVPVLPPNEFGGYMPAYFKTDTINGVEVCTEVLYKLERKS